MLWNFSCPICGDSTKNQRKARGYVYEHTQKLMYRCHNCGASMSFDWFLKTQDPTLHDEYRMELFKETGADTKKPKPESKKPAPAPKVQPKNDPAFKQMVSVKKLPDDHHAVQYLRDRKIPKDKWKYFFYVEKYYTWVHKIKPPPDHKDRDALETRAEHPRLILPYFDKDFTIYRFTARSMDDVHKPKYLYSVLDEEKSSIYNLDFIDRTKRVYVVEGQIDSLFLPNCVAVGNANYGAPELKKLRDKVIVPDNQPRNPEVVKQIKEAVDMGYPVCIWDKHYAKDLNEMFAIGYTLEEIKNIIDRNTYKGAAAQLMFKLWKRC